MTTAAVSIARRVHIVDIVRGIAVVLMAIDHVRVYSGVPAGGPDPGVFFTRWVTHFVAPIFALLAGTSAYFHGARLGDRRALARWLVTRGLFLVLLDLTLMRLMWTFNVGFDRSALAGVLWMLGWCMVLLAGLIRLPLEGLVVFGVALVTLHNVADFLPVGGLAEGSLGWLWRILYFGGPIEAGNWLMFVLFSIVPWIGVMALGYAMGSVFSWEEDRRNRFLRRLGAGMVVAFIVLRALDVYGDRSHWRAQPQAAAVASGADAPPPRPPALLRFLGTSKYPASLQFLLMTLGPAVLLLGAPKALPGGVAAPLEVFGRTPMFYYLLHIPLIHVLAMGVSLVRTGGLEPWLFMDHPAMVPPAPEGYMWPLWLLYLVTAIAVAILYVACRWYARYKATHRDWWLSYV